MKKSDNQVYAPVEIYTMTIEYEFSKMEKTSMGHRVCDNCGQNKDTSGGKSCSKGHFICRLCAKNHIHCPLCGHTLR